VRPLVGRPVAVQREVRIRLAPECRWTIQGHLDLETERVDRLALDPQHGELLGRVAVDGNEIPGALEELEKLRREYVLHERPMRAVNDYKVKKKLISAPESDDDIQATLYLALREVEGIPADDFTFAVPRKPNTKGEWATRLLQTVRDARRRRGVLARFAVMARTIVALYEQLGPEGPWPLADPSNWRCSRKICPHFAACPGGAGL
jgi:hypothetical protein